MFRTLGRGAAQMRLVNNFWVYVLKGVGASVGRCIHPLSSNGQPVLGISGEGSAKGVNRLGHFYARSQSDFACHGGGLLISQHGA